MPELPEVETVRRGLQPVMEGQRIARVETRRDGLRFPFQKDFVARLEGRVVAGLGRRAKYLMADMDSGDVLLMRTGESGARLAQKKDYNPNKPRSGYQAACLPWLHERGISMIGSDVAQDVSPAGYRTVTMPIHMVGIVAMGLWLIDNCQLEDLAATCNRLNRWEFQFALAPIRFQGVTGSPTNPLAVF